MTSQIKNTSIDIYNNIIGLICFIYIILLIFNLANIEHLVNLLFSNSIIKLLFIILICLVAGGFGNKNKACMATAILLTIAYLLSLQKYNNHIHSENFVNNYTEDDTQHDTQYDKENDEEKDTEEKYNNKHTNDTSNNNTDVDLYSAPVPHRPNESVLGAGEPDPLAQCGQDIRSCPSGPFADSGIAYNFNMA